MTVFQGIAAKGGMKSSQVQGSHEDWKTGSGIRAYRQPIPGASNKRLESGKWRESVIHRSNKQSLR